MEGKEVVGSMSKLLGMLKDLFRQIDDGSIKLEQVQAFLEHKNPFEEANPLSDWQNFYQKVFGIKTDFSNLKIPEKKQGFDRLIIVVQGMTPQRLFKKCAETFPCWRWTENKFDTIVQSERTSEKGAYAVWFRNRIEADKELKGLSANELKEGKITGITFEERLLYELKYFMETGKHLDKGTSTLCSGSWRSHEEFTVPTIYWGDNWLYIFWYNSNYHSIEMRSRQAIL